MTESIALRTPEDRELVLLMACARASLSPAQAAHVRALAERGVDWTRLVTLANRNGLEPLLYWHLHRTAARVPADTLSPLRDYFQKNSALSVLLTGELLRLIAALREYDIEAVPFKGPALATTLYGHVALRQFCDLDILVRARDVWRASEVIEALGFEPDDRIPVAQREACIRRDYVRMFRRDGNRTLVELHWGIARRSFAVPFDADTIWPRLRSMTLQGTTVLRPCGEDLLLMLVIHGSRHSWDKLEAVGALAELLRREPDLDWDLVRRRAREMHAERMLRFSLLLAHLLCDVPLPPRAAASRSRTLVAMARGVVRRCTTHDAASRTRTRLRQAAFHLRLKDSYTDQARYCARVAWHAGGTP